jgi:hypothetical protein
MLQRIQSIWLLLASLSLYALFVFPLVHNVHGEGNSLTITATGVFQDANGQLAHTQFFTGLTITTAVVGIIPLIIIFLYNNRKQQVALCYSAMLVVIGLSFWMEKTVEGVTNGAQIALANFGIGALLSSVSILFLVLAVKSINRDEKLVKSADRLR